MHFFIVGGFNFFVFFFAGATVEEVLSLFRPCKIRTKVNSYEWTYGLKHDEGIKGLLVWFPLMG